MMKRVIAIIMAIILCITLIACSNQTPTQTETIVGKSSTSEVVNVTSSKEEVKENKNELSITAYDELVSTVLKEQNVESLSENDLLSFLMIRSLSFRYVPKDLKTSPLFNYSEGMFIVK